MKHDGSINASTFDLTRRVNRRCLECGEQLDGQQIDVAQLAIICDCGVGYPFRVLRASSGVAWELARRRGTYKRDANEFDLDSKVGKELD